MQDSRSARIEPIYRSIDLPSIKSGGGQVGEFKIVKPKSVIQAGLPPRSHKLGHLDDLKDVVA